MEEDRLTDRMYVIFFLFPPSFLLLRDFYIYIHLDKRENSWLETRLHLDRTIFTSLLIIVSFSMPYFLSHIRSRSCSFAVLLNTYVFYFIFLHAHIQLYIDDQERLFCFLIVIPLLYFEEKLTSTVGREKEKYTKNFSLMKFERNCRMRKYVVMRTDNFSYYILVISSICFFFLLIKNSCYVPDFFEDERNCLWISRTMIKKEKNLNYENWKKRIKLNLKNTHTNVEHIRTIHHYIPPCLLSSKRKQRMNE